MRNPNDGLESHASDDEFESFDDEHESFDDELESLDDETAHDSDDMFNFDDVVADDEIGQTSERSR